MYVWGSSRQCLLYVVVEFVRRKYVRADSRAKPAALNAGQSVFISDASFRFLGERADRNRNDYCWLPCLEPHAQRPHTLLDVLAPAGCATPVLGGANNSNARLCLTRAVRSWLIAADRASVNCPIVLKSLPGECLCNWRNKKNLRSVSRFLTWRFFWETLFFFFFYEHMINHLILYKWSII